MNIYLVSKNIVFELQVSKYKFDQMLGFDLFCIKNKLLKLIYSVSADNDTEIMVCEETLSNLDSNVVYFVD